MVDEVVAADNRAEEFAGNRFLHRDRPFSFGAAGGTIGDP
jgi:hypothetical protein